MHNFTERKIIRHVVQEHTSALLDDLLHNLHIEATSHAWRLFRDELSEGLEDAIEHLGLEYLAERM